MKFDKEEVVKKLKFLIEGMQGNGAKYHKIDADSIYFLIKEGSFIDTEEYLRKTRDLFMNLVLY
jgi:hypothetical protein